MGNYGFAAAKASRRSSAKRRIETLFLATRGELRTLNLVLSSSFSFFLSSPPPPHSLFLFHRDRPFSTRVTLGTLRTPKNSSLRISRLGDQFLWKGENSSRCLLLTSVQSRDIAATRGNFTAPAVVNRPAASGSYCHVCI